MSNRWGCYEAVKSGMWSVYCPNCMGVGCYECGVGYGNLGDGEIIMNRCPNSFDCSSVSGIFDGFTFFHNHKIMPNSGGSTGQSDNFKRVEKLSGMVQSLIDKEKRNRNK